MTLEAFVDLVVPELQTRGAFKTRYAEGTLREKLFPGTGPHLKASHPGAGWKCSGGVRAAVVPDIDSTAAGLDR